ncbi:MAG: 3',5'-cyclic-nucleotide phosphodiesterase, partial [Nitrospirae bacterium]|nr:3',5'-cyclic-nucleotide phosphodiesterase [Nitrospirota bacterium]
MLPTISYAFCRTSERALKVKVLGCSGAELPGYNPPAFLIDGKVLLDAGTIGSSLRETLQWEIRDILITHAHLDHIKAIPFLADNIIIKNKHHSVTVFGTKSTLDDLRSHLLNDRLWPDFTRIAASVHPVLRLKNIREGAPFRVNGYSVTAYAVNHTVPAVGYVISDERGRTLLYTGDTGPTGKIWRSAGHVHAAIVEVSFPNAME